MMINRLKLLLLEITYLIIKRTLKNRISSMMKMYIIHLMRKKLTIMMTMKDIF